MGYFEATVLFWCPREYDFKSLAAQLEQHTKVTRLVDEPVPEALGYLREAREGEQIDRLASLYLRDWYKLPPSEGIESVFCDDEDSPIIVYGGDPTALQLVTMAELFQGPVPPETVELAITQFGELVRLIGSMTNADCAWLTPVFSRSIDYIPYLKRTSETSIATFPSSDHNFVLFGCQTTNGFCVFTERRPFSPD